MSAHPVEGHIERGCPTCEARARTLDATRILEIAMEVGREILVGPDGETLVGQHRLDDLLLVRGATPAGDTVALRSRIDAPEHGTRFMGGRL